MSNERDDLAEQVGQALNELPVAPNSTALPVMLPDELDDRFDGVHLLWISDEGDAKRTALRTIDGWRVSEWEIGEMNGSHYWVTTWGYYISDADLNNLRALSATT